LTALQDYVKTAADLGFKHLAFNDHFVFNLDPTVAVASVLGVSGEMKIVPSVLLPVQRGLVPSAKLLAALDILSGGRVIAGIGPGSMELEYEINGLQFSERWSRFDEIAMALRSLLQPDEPAFKGKFYSTEGVRLVPMPAQKPKLPIWIGSWGSDAGLRRVARLGDGWIASAFHSTPRNFREHKEKLAGHLYREGKDPASFPNAVSTMFMFISRDQAQLDEMSRGGPFGGFQRDAAAAGNEPPPAAMQRAAADHVRQPPLVGTPEQCAERLAGFAEAGVQTFYVQPMREPRDQIQLFMEEVAPLVGRAAAAAG
jgi:alkanesulfonate monooxygenase SsuD/methylene tetrahydromethanopterin reductase-like flavin-dependent oxidoreductase (luciferase family)